MWQLFANIVKFASNKSKQKNIAAEIRNQFTEKEIVFGLQRVMYQFEISVNNFVHRILQGVKSELVETRAILSNPSLTSSD
jgi:hypothetical protein